MFKIYYRKNKGIRGNDMVLIMLLRGLRKIRATQRREELKLKPGEFRVTPDGKYPARGPSLNADPSKVVPYGGAYKIVSMPEGLDVIHTPSNANPLHFDVIPKDLGMSEQCFQNLLNQIKIEPLGEYNIDGKFIDDSIDTSGRHNIKCG
jgi:hypothetical protein